MTELYGATQADADACNALDPPTAGAQVGGGLHVVIPGDWREQIKAGREVPGCSYAVVRPIYDDNGDFTDTVLLVSAVARARLADTAKLAPDEQAKAEALRGKLDAEPGDEAPSKAEPGDMASSLRGR